MTADLCVLYESTYSSKGSTMEPRRTDAKAPAEMMKHYPWIEKLDHELRSNLTTPEVTVTSGHVLKLLTFLESHISPEVSKLRNKPNRATKLISLIKKRICMIKLGGYMLEDDAELELFPTYALLMTHYVNITLASSKVEKQGPQAVASDLYYWLKIIFQNDIEFVIDVALCSTLDEHASRKEDVGFQFFSYIVDDWRVYIENYSRLMKYCAVASLLAESGDGKMHVDQNLPMKTDLDFQKYLNKAIEGNFKVSKAIPLSQVVSQIKERKVIALARKRLVVVSRKDVAKRARADSDAASTASTTSTVITGATHKKAQANRRGSVGENPSQSFNDMMSNLGLGFSLDVTGDNNLRFSENESGDVETVSLTEESLVSSSTHKMSRSSKRKAESESIEIDMNTKKDTNGIATSRRDKSNSSLISDDEEERDSSQSDLNEDGEEEEGIDNDTYERDSDAASIGGELRKELDAEIPSDDDRDKDENEYDHVWNKVGPNEASEESDDEDMIIRTPRKRSKGKSLIVESDDADTDTSDIQVIGVKEAEDDDDSNSNDSDASRDEADAESGEDVIPNYDEDSDEDGLKIDEDYVESKKDDEDGMNIDERSRVAGNMDEEDEDHAKDRSAEVMQTESIDHDSQNVSTPVSKETTSARNMPSKETNVENMEVDVDDSNCQVETAGSANGNSPHNSSSGEDEDISNRSGTETQELASSQNQNESLNSQMSLILESTVVIKRLVTKRPRMTLDKINETDDESTSSQPTKPRVGGRVARKSTTAAVKAPVENENAQPRRVTRASAAAIEASTPQKSTREKDQTNLTPSSSQATINTATEESSQESVGKSSAPGTTRTKPARGRGRPRGTGRGRGKAGTK